MARASQAATARRRQAHRAGRDVHDVHVAHRHETALMTDTLHPSVAGYALVVQTCLRSRWASGRRSPCSEMSLTPVLRPSSRSNIRSRPKSVDVRTSRSSAPPSRASCGTIRFGPPRTGASPCRSRATRSASTVASGGPTPMDTGWAIADSRRAVPTAPRSPPAWPFPWSCRSSCWQRWHHPRRCPLGRHRRLSRRRPSPACPMPA